MSELFISHAEALEMAQQKATDSNLARRFIELHAEHARLRKRQKRRTSKCAGPSRQTTPLPLR